MLNFTEAECWTPPIPLERTPEGYGVVSRDTYSHVGITQLIHGSDLDPETKGRVLMRGCKRCLYAKHSFSHAITAGGWAVEVAIRYLRRFYPKKIFFDHDELWPILRKVADKYPMAAGTLKAFYSHFNFFNLSKWDDEHSIYFKGKHIFLSREKYQMCLSIYRQTEKLEQLEKMKDEKTRN